MPEVLVVSNPLRVRNGQVSVPKENGPGLGALVNEDILGEPVSVIENI
jgi:hypothetical protein